jgi:prolipoprotein diacylglyceryltransferase
MACLSTGCCFGNPIQNENLGLVFTNDYCPANPKNVPLFPIQIMDSLFALVLFFVYLYIHKVKKLEPGSVFSSFCIIYPIYRFISENFRADVSRGFVFDGLLSLSQFYSLLILFAAILILAIKKYFIRNKFKSIDL